MSPNREDYLKAIFNANEQGIKLTNKGLAEELNISPASSSEMISKLVEAKKVERHSKLGIVLTPSGRAEATQLVRKHRLWEVFLVEHLGYTWTEIHEEAEVLEHVTSDKLADRLDAFLGNPAYCPHGSVVYGNEPHDISVPLVSLETGERSQLVEVHDDINTLSQLEAHAIQLGAQIEIVSKGQLVIMKVDERTVELPLDVVQSMLVKRI